MGLEKLFRAGVFSLCVLLDGESIENGGINIGYKANTDVNYNQNRNMKEELLEKEEKDTSRTRGPFDYKSGNYFGIRVA